MEPPFLSGHAKLAFVMPNLLEVELTPLPASDETPGQSLARLPGERGFTQVELVERTGLVQTLVSGYERGKLRLKADMILRFTTALDVFPTNCYIPFCSGWNALRLYPPMSRPLSSGVWI